MSGAAFILVQVHGHRVSKPSSQTHTSISWSDCTLLEKGILWKTQSDENVLANKWFGCDDFLRKCLVTQGCQRTCTFTIKIMPLHEVISYVEENPCDYIIKSEVLVEFITQTNLLSHVLVGTDALKKWVQCVNSLNRLSFIHLSVLVLFINKT